MAILFLTASLEPGKDGVGDYTRLLARECIRQNQACCLVALNDPYVSDPIESVESGGDRLLPMLRLPINLAWEKRIILARAFRARHPIEWISLQFVSYGFHAKGIVPSLTRHLEPIMTGYPVHIMFHELWIGVRKSPPLKERITGQIQRYYIQALARRLKPRWVTTSNAFYQSLLAGIGVSSGVLPLFGNIPVISPGDFHLPEALVQTGICDEHGSHPGRWLGLFFGSLYSEWKPEPLIGILLAASKKAHQRVALITAGRLGPSGETIWKKLRDDYADVIDFVNLGEQPEDQVSVLMQIADFGVAASPWSLIGKSGSATAMLDHGLPVIVTRDDFPTAPSSSLPDDSLLHRCDASLESKLVSGLRKRPAQNRWEEIARDFIHGLVERTSS